MENLKMHTPDLAKENFKKLAAMFPNAVTETINEDGEVVRAIDADVLRQEISATVVEGAQERYQFTWPDKKKSVVLANQPIAQTLRLDREKSVGRDGTPGSIDTENIYIEGDNLDALKLLQETYLGKVKVIYIDPPYNTGSDFIYEDNFSLETGEYLENSGQFDEKGNRLVQNTESNGRFHTDWLNMLYPRLRIAKDLLCEDGAIFVSIDEHEHASLVRIMSEVFGPENYIDSIVWDKKASAKGVPPRNMMVNVHEYIVVYQKGGASAFRFIGEQRDAEADGFKNPDNDPRGPWRESNIKSTTKPIEEAFTITDPDTGRQYMNTWAFSKESLDRMIVEKRILWKESLPKQKEFLHEMTNENKAIKSSWGVFDAQSTTVFLKKLIPQVHFDNPKPINLMKYLMSVAVGPEDYVMDFFSGSGTTAHALLQQNAEDGGRRKFILVQIQEPLGEETDAYVAGFKNICDVGEERLRRVGKIIKEESPLTTGNLDIGFRVFRVDTTNMEDVYYRPADYNQGQMQLFANNIKADRTPEDLLFQVMLDLGILLSSDIEETEIAGKKVFSVAGGYLIACFDSDVTEETVTEIAKRKPFYAVFRDSGMANDSVMTNFEQIFETYSPKTQRKVL